MATINTEFIPTKDRDMKVTISASVGGKLNQVKTCHVHAGCQEGTLAIPQEQLLLLYYSYYYCYIITKAKSIKLKLSGDVEGVLS